MANVAPYILQTETWRWEVREGKTTNGRQTHMAFCNLKLFQEFATQLTCTNQGTQLASAFLDILVNLTFLNIHIS